MRGHASVPDTNHKNTPCATGGLFISIIALFHLHYIISIIPFKATENLVLLDEERYGVLN